MKHDHTFDEIAAYGSDRYCATVLGKSLDWFKKHRAELEADGFPKIDRLIGLTSKADVEAWLAGRRRLADRIEVRNSVDTNLKENLNVL